MWFRMRPAGLDFLERSPHRFENVLEVDASAERTFQILAGERFGEWLPELRSCVWTSSEPHGVGSTRIVTLNTLAAKERFLVWEEGRRLTFVIEESTAPLMRRMIEDMRVEPLGDRRCRLRWIVHYEPSMGLRLIHPIAKLPFARMFRGAARRVAKIAAS